ncbi:MAG: aldo/keto reductase [Pirellulales bacterium]
MAQNRLGRGGPVIGPLGFGAFKIGRNQQTKYGRPYDLPDEAASARLLNDVLDLGIDYIDTAPAYGLSEERIGRAIAHRRNEFALSTKVGEVFENGQSRFDFSHEAVEASLRRSLTLLTCDCLDMVFIHSNGNDLAIMGQTDIVATLTRFKRQGVARGIGLSAKTVLGASAALKWADAIMVELHTRDRSFEPVIAEAAAAGVSVIVKKALSSGTLPADESLRFVLGHAGVASAVVGSLNLDHLRDNLATCVACRSRAT